jgi:hypothetical protein
VLLLTASPRRLGFDNSWLSSIVRSPRPCLSTDAPCTFPPTRFSISGRSMWRSTWHFVCDEVAISDARVLHVPTTSQFADIFTRVCPRLSWSLLVPAGGGCYPCEVLLLLAELCCTGSLDCWGAVLVYECGPQVLCTRPSTTNYIGHPCRVGKIH